MREAMKKMVFILLTISLISACNPEQQAEKASFQLLTKEETGLDFENVLKQSAQFNSFLYMYFYNGGGTAAGDFNNDGLIDLFFTSNMESNKLFLNQGNMTFQDATADARLEGMPGWTTGAAVVDINDDGLLDIYVSQVGDFEDLIRGRNQLYVCQGIENGVPVFEDEAIPYGLDLIGLSTQATFFDYDLDGDLDMFQLNHSLHDNTTFGKKASFEGTFHPLAGDKLLRNDNGVFTDITEEAGLNSTIIGYGLGVATGDINQDGWPDIYVGNDFHENDYLYINQQDGTFKEVLTQQMKQTSRFSMGVDIGDINNDAYPEVISLDMLPEDPKILRRSQTDHDFAIYNFRLGFGYNHQYSRNALQLNNGDGTFSEIGRFANVFASDWSWAPLFVDFDNDGYKDLFVSNGIPRRLNDLDYINFHITEDYSWRMRMNEATVEDLQMFEKMPQIKLRNKFFKNQQDLSFKDLSGQIRDNTISYSNGAIYADLDNDGDQDLVVNNIEDEPFIYKNLNREQSARPHDFLKIQLKGPRGNQQAIGTRLMVYKGEQVLCQEHFAVRGFQSSMLGPLHLGVGDRQEVDSVLVVWPDQTYEKLDNPVFNKIAGLSWKTGLPKFDFARFKKKKSYSIAFKDITREVGLAYRYDENPFIEFNREALIPHMVSTPGPALAVADVNGDGLDDLFMGGAKRNQSHLFFQQADGTFSEVRQPAFQQDSIFEDAQAIFTDIENDGDQDLVVASGGNEFWGTNEALKQRIYINDGKGNFSDTPKAIPDIFLTASCVLAEDFNRDGFVDLFFGGRAVPWNYGLIPESYLLLNDGSGRFKDVTRQYSEELYKAGLVKNGAWSDIDQDGDPDLILALEWGPVTVFRNDGTQFKRMPVGESGWWNFALPFDFDQDGDVDILAGNLGQNSKLKASKDQPVKMYVADFDDNGQKEQLLTYFLKGQEIPFATHTDLTKQMPSLKKNFLYAKDFAQASVEDLLGQEAISRAEVREVSFFGSVLYLNEGNGQTFTAQQLPNLLQWSPLVAPALADLDKEGASEVLLGGNFYENRIDIGRYDASYGHILSFDENVEMKVEAVGDLKIEGQVRQIQPIVIGGKQCFVLGKNDDLLQVIQLLSPGVL